jgi:hypothetical protein
MCRAQLLEDAFELNLGPGAVPALEVGAKDQSVAPLVRRQPCAKGDRPAVLPHPFGDLAGAWSCHQSHRFVVGVMRKLGRRAVLPSRRLRNGETAVFLACVRERGASNREQDKPMLGG